MSEESKRVLEIEDAADYTDTPIHEWSDGVIAKYRASAKTLARQVEALEAEKRLLREAFRAARNYINASPCDPDITAKQRSHFSVYADYCQELVNAGLTEMGTDWPQPMPPSHRPGGLT